MNISSLASKEHDYDWVVKLNRPCLRFIGIWPQDIRREETFLTKLYVATILILYIFVCTIPCFMTLFMKCTDLLSYMDCLSYCVPLMMTILKYITIYNKRKVIGPVLNMIAEDWTKSKSDVERVVMTRRAQIVRVFALFGYLCSIVSAMFILVAPKFGIPIRYTLNGTEMFPLPAYYWYDVSKSPYYEIIFTLHLFAIPMTVTCYIGVDNLFGTLILHVCGQLENLRIRLSNMKESEDFDRILAAAILDHMRLIRAVDAIEDTYTLLLLALLLYFGTFACIYGFMLITAFAEKSSYPAVRLVFLMITLLNTFLQTSLYCIAGQILVSQSAGVFDAVYQCEWLHLKSKDAKNLILIMARAKKPLYLSAGNIYPMTMLTFCNILKISFSYISFLMAQM